MSTQTVKTDVIQVMEDRHAVKEYQKGHPMPKEHLDQILKATTTAPSSWNLQHWKFIIIEDQAYKEKLLPIANGQKQIVDSSVVIAVLGDLEANQNFEPVFGPLAAAGHMSQQIKDILASQVEGAYKFPQFARDEANRNASFAAMQLMLAAKALGYDSCPMGGFDRDRFVKEFNVPARYTPVLLISVGLAASPARPSTRLSVEDVIVRNTF